MRIQILLRLLLLGLVLAMVPTELLAAKRVRINLGTLAPRGSLYHKALQSMGNEWRKESKGTVRLVIYPDGTQGGEASMVRLMRIGSLHAGLFTAVGLSTIEPGVAGLQNMPMMFRSLEEFEHVNLTLRPKLEQRLNEKGFVVLFWVDAGWVRYFSKEPLVRPDDLKKMKLFVWAGNTDQVDIMKSAGYQPVPLETGEILTALQTGLISSLNAPPIFALASQLDTRAPHMLELNWAPLVGAAVVRKKVWDTIPEETRKLLLASAAKAGAEIQAKSRQENNDSVTAMKKRGLIVQTVNEALEAEWRTAVESFYPKIRGTLIPDDIFDEVTRVLKEYRAGPGKAKP